MEKQQSSWRGQLVIYLIIEVAIFFVVGAIWWFGSKHTVRYFSDLCFMVGGVVMFLGVLVYQGSRGTTGSFGYQYAQTINLDDMHERTARDWKERFANEGQILVFIGLGAIPMLTGILVTKIWG